MPVTIDDIQAAADLVAGEVLRTPSIVSMPLSDLSGARVVLKLENLQHTCSFKTRGALVKLASLDAADKLAGVIAASAGNHAQGVAFHAQRLGIPATIVMPKPTPFTKVARTEALGARVVLHGAGLAEARDHALGLAAEEDLQFIHPYDDEKIIAGQGTVGLELLVDHPELEVLLVPIGGGGLIAGIAVAAKALKPDIEVVGVEAALYPSMYHAVRDEEPQAGGETVAEGIAVKTPGTLTRPVVKDLVADILLVGEPVLERAVQTYLEVQRLVVEGAGAASLAALLDNRERFAGCTVGLVVSGGNIDSRVLSSILMRGLVREGRMVCLRIAITDAPGTLAKVTSLIAACGGNIMEVHHQRLFYDVPVKLAEVDIVVETLGADHVQELMDKLIEAGFLTRLLSGASGAPNA